MLSFSAVVNRANTGPICAQKDFELRIFYPNLRKAIKAYDIRFDPLTPVPADDGLADRVWAAGIDFLCDTGVYVPDTERRLLFSRDEIEAALSAGTREVAFGESSDRKVVPRRRPEDEIPPFCTVSGGGTPMSSEELFLSLVKATAENPLADGVTTPSLSHVDGQLITAGSPLEIEGAIRTVVLTREALRRAGRPGLPICNAVASAVRAGGHIAGYGFGVRKTDAMEMGTIHEMVVDFDVLNKSAFSQSAGTQIWVANGTVLGGLAGGPVGTAVVTAAYHMVDVLVLRAAVQHPVPIHFDLRASTARDTLWARNVANQAAARNGVIPIVNVGYPGAGPMTAMVLYELAALVVGCVVSGGSIEVGPTALGVNVDHSSPVEPVFASELAHAVAGMGREEANRIVNALLDVYEAQIRNPPIGQRYQDCCNVKTGFPKSDFVALYRRVRQDMTDRFGIEFRHASPYCE